MSRLTETSRPTARRLKKPTPASTTITSAAVRKILEPSRIPTCELTRGLCHRERGTAIAATWRPYADSNRRHSIQGAHRRFQQQVQYRNHIPENSIASTGLGRTKPGKSLAERSILEPAPTRLVRWREGLPSVPRVSGRRDLARVWTLTDAGVVKELSISRSVLTRDAHVASQHIDSQQI